MVSAWEDRKKKNRREKRILTKIHGIWSSEMAVRKKGMEMFAWLVLGTEGSRKEGREASFPVPAPEDGQWLPWVPSQQHSKAFFRSRKAAGMDLQCWPGAEQEGHSFWMGTLLGQATARWLFSWQMKRNRKIPRESPINAQRDIEKGAQTHSPGQGGEELLFNGPRVSVLQDEKSSGDECWCW